MHFHYIKGAQYLDLKGNLVLSRNIEFITAPAKSAAPKVRNGKYIMLSRLSFVQKLKATVRAIDFIWWGK